MSLSSLVPCVFCAPYGGNLSGCGWGKSLVLTEKCKKIILKNGMCRGKGGHGVSYFVGPHKPSD